MLRQTSFFLARKRVQGGEGRGALLPESSNWRVQATFVRYGVAGYFSTLVAHSCTIRNLLVQCPEFGILRLGGSFGHSSVCNVFGSAD